MCKQNQKLSQNYNVSEINTLQNGNRFFLPPHQISYTMSTKEFTPWHPANLDQNQFKKINFLNFPYWGSNLGPPSPASIVQTIGPSRSSDVCNIKLNKYKLLNKI